MADKWRVSRDVNYRSFFPRLQSEDWMTIARADKEEFSPDPCPWNLLISVITDGYLWMVKQIITYLIHGWYLFQKFVHLSWQIMITLCNFAYVQLLFRLGIPRIPISLITFIHFFIHIGVNKLFCFLDGYIFLFLTLASVFSLDTLSSCLLGISNVSSGFWIPQIAVDDQFP